MSHDPADEFLLSIKREKPELYSQVAKKYPVQSKYTSRRDKLRRIESVHRRIHGKSGGVPVENKIKMSPSEWSEFQEAKRAYSRERRVDYLHALELVQEG